MATQGTAAQVRVRLYMEGRLVENALVSTMVQGGVGAASTAQLELVPTNTLKHILPGTWIHIFTTDPWDAVPAGDLSDFKLLFEGIVVARGFTKAATGRNVVIQCADASIYWNNAKQFWLNIGSANGGIVDQLAVQTSGGYGQFGTLSSTGSYGYMTSKLTFSDKAQPEERFMDTLISVLDDIGNVNPYYTNARNRFRITDRIIRGPAGKTEKLFQLAMISDWLDGLAGRVSGQTNLVDVVNQLLSAIFHEWVSVLAPPYVKARVFDRDTFGNIKRNKKTVTKRGPRGRTTVDLFDYETAEDMVLGTFIFKPDIYTLPPPTCNVLFPCMFEKLSFMENFLQETTRLSMRPQLPLVSAAVTSGMLLQRPTELEIFTALVRDPARKTTKMRTPDGQFADGAGQAPTFTDYDWTTNEERIRGIVYNFMNLAPAASGLTLGDPGAKQPDGSRKGGVPRYLQNVASYEWYKSKFVSRQTELSGPYNMRPVAGFPVLALDDSEANLSMVAYLQTIQHNIDAQGSATTTYGVTYPRLVDEVDYNQPKFKGSNAGGELDFDLVRNDDGSFEFKTLFDGDHQPPIPEWFDESFRNVVDLNLKYKEWFGKDAGVVQNVLFKNQGEQPDVEAVKIASELFGQDHISFSSVGAAAVAYQDHKEEFEQILEENEKISLANVVVELSSRYKLARVHGTEFDTASRFTDRSFAKIDEAFRFVGAAPLELADPFSVGQAASSVGAGVSGAGNVGPQFTKNPAGGRTIDYARMKLEYFVGDPSAGSGYAGTPEGSAPPAAVKSTTQTTGDLVPDAISGADLAPPADRMSGAFPVFDTKIHIGQEATDKKTRNALIKSGAERAASHLARYDGRPLMYDFEFRLWQQSLKEAGLTPTSEKIAENADASDYFVLDGKGNVVRPKNAAERAAAVTKRQANLATSKTREDAKVARGKKSKNKTSITNRDQAPTGDGLEEGKKLPLPQPLSEKQVVDLRRFVIDAYRDELARNRGFNG